VINVSKLTKGNAVAAKLRKMRSTDGDEDETVGGASSPTSAKPAWMMTIRDQALEWLKTLPEVSWTWGRLTPQTLATPAQESSPLARFYAREIATGQKLLSRIRRDLSELIKVCNGEVKQTNESRALLADLNQGMPFV
jgi:dynein heavy chain 1